MNIFVGITEIAGFQSAVAAALRRRGHQVHAVLIKPYDPGYRDDGNSGFSARITTFCQWLGRLRGRSLLHKILWKSVTSALRVVALAWAVFACEAFIFSFGRSFLPWNLDAPLLRLLGKRVLFVFLGSDSRPAYLDCGGVLFPDGSRKTPAQTRRMVRRQRATVRRIDRWSSWVIDNPWAAHFHTRRIINWFTVGMPCAPLPEMPPEPESGLRVLHAPSYPLYKGTARIAEAVARVQAERPELEFVTITGRPRQEVLDAITSCHFVIDQMYSDTPSAGFVTEAAACGRPAIVGGYGWSDDWLRISGLGEWPSLVCREEELEEAIRRLADDVGLRQSTAAAARRRAAEWSSDKVGERMETILSGRAPEEWFFDPRKIAVFNSGGGIPQHVLAESLRELIGTYGLEVLGLEDKPRLERMALALAGLAPPEPGR